MSDNKYYPPTAEEFYPGFEYQFQFNRKGDKWLKVIHAFFKGEIVEKRLPEGKIRVKYLDREDIESLGFNWFRAKGSYDSTDTVEKEVYLLPHKGDDRKNKERIRTIIRVFKDRIIIQHLKFFIVGEGINPKGIWRRCGYRILFSGTIKNKSQLKQILQWTGILK